MEFQHKPVLFDEAIASLEIRPDGVYIDGTAGGGGHSKAIADRLTTGTTKIRTRLPWSRNG